MGRSEGRNWPPNEDHSKRAAVVSVWTVAVAAVVFGAALASFVTLFTADGGGSGANAARVPSSVANRTTTPAIGNITTVAAPHHPLCTR